MKRHNVFGLMILLLFNATVSYGVTFGSSAMHVHPAWTIPKGSLYIGGNSNAFFKDEIHTTSTQGVSSAVTYWDVQGKLGVLYGFTPMVQFYASQIIYQDTNQGDPGYNLPDDLWLRVKFGSIGQKNSSVRLGAQLDLRLPTGDTDNIPLEPYQADRIGLGVMGLFSIISEPLSPSMGVNINANLGFFNHNDAGLALTGKANDTITNNNSTKEMLYGVSFSRMLQEFGFFTELYGNYFIQEPPITAYTRENSLYITPGVVHTPNPWLRLKAGLDIRLVGDNDDTSYLGQNGSLLNKPWQDVPNMPSWRINICAVITLRSGATQPADTGLFKKKETSYTSPTPTKTQDALYEELAKERKNTESAEMELERIRSERERMENLLNRLRNILEKPSGTGESESTEEKSESEKKPKSQP